MVSVCHWPARNYINTASKVGETAQLSPCLFWVSLSMLLCSNDAWRQRYINYRPVARISRKGICRIQHGSGWVQEGKLREYTIFESLRMNGPGTSQICPLPPDVVHIMNAPRPSPSSASVHYCATPTEWQKLGCPGNEADCVTFHRL